MPPASINTCSDTPQQVAVYDGELGFSVFDLGSARLVRACRDESVEPDADFPEEALPLLYIHDGNVLLGGSHIGRVHLWDITTSKQKVVQILRHPGQFIIHLSFGMLVYFPMQQQMISQ